MAFREKWGLSTSAALIKRLAEDPDANRDFGFPVSDAEAEELLSRGDIAPGLDGLHQYVESHGNRFGGIYIDNRAGGEVVIQVTAQATDAHRVAARSSVPIDIDVRFEEVSNSYNDLKGAHEALNDLLRVDTDAVADITGIDQILGENVLRIRVLPESLQSVRDYVRREFGGGLFRFEEGGLDRPSACTDRFNCWNDPLRGGIAMYKTPSLPCTIGFMVYNTSGTRRLLTAGHCIDTSGTRYHDGNSIGGPSKNSFYDGSYSDLGILYGGPNLNGSPDWSGHRIYRTNSDKSYAITGQNGPSTLGQPANMAGIASGIEFGEVVSVNHTSNWGGGFYLFYMKVGDFENAPGDSGAPVFYSGTAMGVQSGCVSAPGEDCYTDNTQDSVFSSIDQLWVANDGPNGADFQMKVCRSGDAETAC